MYKTDLALNNLKQLIWHKTKPKQTKPNSHTIIYQGKDLG